MLTKLIVSSYEKLVEVTLWIFLLACVIGGSYLGSLSDNAIYGGVGGLVLGFVVAVLLFGAFLILGDIRNSVRKIEAQNASG